MNISNLSNKNRNLFHTEFATYAGFSVQIPNVIKYTTNNRHYLLSPEEVDRMARSIRMILQSPLTQFFNRIVDTGGLQHYAALNITEKGGSVPELLTANNITLDLKQALDNQAITLPETRNKVLLNVTGCLKFNRPEGQYDIKIVDLFQQLVVRGCLCMGYFDQDDWLNPTLAEFTVRSYSMILSNMIARYYDLTLMEQMTVAGIFAFYYCQKFSRDGVIDPPLFNRCTFLGSRNDLENIRKICLADHNDVLTLSETAEIIKNNSPERMRNFSNNEVNILCGNLGPDTITTLLALEYPPYWVYMLLLALSGTKIPLTFQLNNQRLMNEGRSRFLSNMLSSNNLFNLSRG